MAPHTYNRNPSSQGRPVASPWLFRVPRGAYRPTRSDIVPARELGAFLGSGAVVLLAGSS